MIDNVRIREIEGCEKPTPRPTAEVCEMNRHRLRRNCTHDVLVGTSYKSVHRRLPEQRGPASAHDCARLRATRHTLVLRLALEPRAPDCRPGRSFRVQGTSRMAQAGHPRAPPRWFSSVRFATVSATACGSSSPPVPR